ncbi:hypothetical protein, partial [uncultured Acetobacterium sp.]|uniref:hypothetical protein n=1 Tax=uncultured Acetobacterium sp. TaxID=217139 RepID=UPI0025EFFF54
IRTSGLLTPSQARYQAALHPDSKYIIMINEGLIKLFLFNSFKPIKTSTKLRVSTLKKTPIPLEI